MRGAIGGLLGRFGDATGAVWRPMVAGLVLVLSALPLILGGTSVGGTPSEGRSGAPPGEHDDAPVLGERERVEIHGPDGRRVGAVADVDTGATYSSIDDDLARELGLDLDNARVAIISSAIGREYRPLVRVRLRVGGRTVGSEVTVADRDGLDNQVLVGRRDLEGFLVRVGDASTDDGPPNDAGSGDAASEAGPGGARVPALLAALPVAALPAVALRYLAGLQLLGLMVPVLISVSAIGAGPKATILGAALALLALLANALLRGRRWGPPPFVLPLVLLAAGAVLLTGATSLEWARATSIPPSALLLMAVALFAERFLGVAESAGVGRALEATCWTLLAAVAAGALLVAEPVLRVAESTPLLPAALTVAAALLVWLLGGRPGGGMRKEPPQ